MSEVEELLITKSQYNALNEIRGLHQDAFRMVVAAKRYSNGYVLKGTTEAFDHLRADVGDEVYHELSPKSRLKHLRSLMYRLDPDVDDF